MTITDILNAIQANSLIIILVAVAYALFKQRKTSFVVVVLMLAATNLIHMIFQILMNMLFDSPMFDGFVYELAIRLWYIFYASTDLFVAVFIYYALNKIGLKPSLNCHVIAISFILLGLIQLARFADIFVFNTHAVTKIYISGIPFINTFVVIITVVGIVVESLRKKEY